jgi:hypothetical protein
MLLALHLLQVTLPAPAWSRAPVPFAEPRLAESSALAVSPAHPGVLWSLNDSDNPTELFATDTAGRTLGRVTVRGAANRDWEALVTGPCPRGTARCLYIGDIGDNERKHRYITIYRMGEPDPTRDTLVAVLDSLRIAYPDSARDAEAMAIDARGDLWIVSKELIRAPRIYRVPAAAWRSGAVAKAMLIGILPIPSESGIDHWTTDAAWTDDGRALAVRTYGGLWKVPFPEGRPDLARTRPLCSLAGFGVQGEGLAWLGGDLYALSSEKLFGSPASVALVRCPG